MAFLEYDKVEQKTADRMRNILEGSYKHYWKRKRIFDLIVTFFLLTILIVPILIISLIIVIDDPHGGPFYYATRIGRHGKEFKMIKFRSMCVGADKKKADLMDRNEMSGPVFKIKDDPRITRVGKVIRKLSLDEIPQFFNVFVGQMSLVGPRPPLPDEVEQYTDYQKLRLLVTPGITCTWQIADNRNDIQFDEWIEMDLDYIENRTTWKDIKIMIQTPFSMLKGTGR